jgi:hypothetical protein
MCFCSVVIFSLLKQQKPTTMSASQSANKSSDQGAADRVLGGTVAFDATATPPPLLQQDTEEKHYPDWMRALVARAHEIRGATLETQVQTKDGETVRVDTTGIESAINCTPFDRCESNAERQALHDRTCRAAASYTAKELAEFQEFWGIDWVSRAQSEQEEAAEAAAAGNINA